nr:MAG TPA: hypothetical protein [Caudoviricetes sp.]
MPLFLHKELKSTGKKLRPLPICLTDSRSGREKTNSRTFRQRLGRNQPFSRKIHNSNSTVKTKRCLPFTEKSTSIQDNSHLHR